METSVDKGLGACVLTAALIRNSKEGYPGRYYGTEINPEAGYLLQEEYAEFGEILWGDSIESLKKFDKKIDMFIHDGPMILYLASENETKGLTALFTPLTREYLAWGIRKDNVELLESANNFLRTSNEVGKLGKIIKYWIPLAK